MKTETILKIALISSLLIATSTVWAEEGEISGCTYAARCITSTRANLRGYLLDNVGSEDCEYSFNYWPDQGPVVATSWISFGDYRFAGVIVEGLEPDTVYHFQLLVRCGSETDTGSTKTFRTLASDPVTPPPTSVDVVDDSDLSCCTYPARLITSTRANLRGYLLCNGGSEDVEYSFNYWTDQGPMMATSWVSCGDYRCMGVTVDTLEPDTVYCFQLVVRCGSTTKMGSAREFRTLTSDPVPASDDPLDDSDLSCCTYPARLITTTSANLRGHLLCDGGEDAECSFLYWQDQGPAMATSWVSFEDSAFAGVTVDTLEPDTMYYFQLMVRCSSGTDTGSVREFRTLASDPFPASDDPVDDSDLSCCTYPARLITSTSANLRGYLLCNAGDDVEYSFNYWTDQGPVMSTSWVSFGDSSFAGVTVNTLEPDTVYYFQLLARCGSGTDIGSVGTFRTLASDPIPASDDPVDESDLSCCTYPARLITSTSANLRGYLLCNAGGEPEYSFNYWSDQGPVTSTSWVSFGDSSFAGVTVSTLEPDTAYYFQLVIRCGSTAKIGSVREFRTLAP